MLVVSYDNYIMAILKGIAKVARICLPPIIKYPLNCIDWTLSIIYDNTKWWVNNNY